WSVRSFALFAAPPKSRRDSLDDLPGIPHPDGGLDLRIRQDVQHVAHLRLELGGGEIDGAETVKGEIRGQVASRLPHLFLARARPARGERAHGGEKPEPEAVEFPVGVDVASASQSEGALIDGTPLALGQAAGALIRVLVELSGAVPAAEGQRPALEEGGE